MSVPVAELPPHDPLPHHCHQAPSHCSVEPVAVPEQLLSKDAEKCTLQPLWFICPSPHHGSSSCTGHARRRCRVRLSARTEQREKADPDRAGH